MRKMPVILVLAFIILAIALGGCFGSPQKVVVTVSPPTVPPTITPTPMPTANVPVVTATDGMTTVTGSNNQLVRGVRLGSGVYVVSWSSPGSFLSLSLTDVNGNGVSGLSKGQPTGSRLFVVDGGNIKDGEFTLLVDADSDWSVSLSRPDTSSPSELPLSVPCSELNGAITKPFYAHTGIVRISYTLSHVTAGTGSINIYDASTGQPFYTRPIAGDAAVGQSTAEAPANSVYIAQITLPDGASYGDFTISQ